MHKLEQSFINKFLRHHHSSSQFAEALPLLPPSFPAAQSVRNAVIHALNMQRLHLKFTSGSHQLQLPEATLQEWVVSPTSVQHCHRGFVVTLNHNSQQIWCWLYGGSSETEVSRAVRPVASDAVHCACAPPNSPNPRRMRPGTINYFWGQKYLNCYWWSGVHRQYLACSGGRRLISFNIWFWYASNSICISYSYITISFFS